MCTTLVCKFNIYTRCYLLPMQVLFCCGFWNLVCKLSGGWCWAGGCNCGCCCCMPKTQSWRPRCWAAAVLHLAVTSAQSAHGDHLGICSQATSVCADTSSPRTRGWAVEQPQWSPAPAEGGDTAACSWGLLCLARWCGAAQVRGEMSAAIKSKGGAAAGAWWPALSAPTSR